MARSYSNENFPRRVVDALRLMGHDVVTSFEAGNANQRISDAAVLRYATDRSRAVLTLNRRDFILLHRADDNHAGVIVCTVDHDPNALATRINEALPPGIDVTGRLVRIVKSAMRKR